MKVLIQNVKNGMYVAEHRNWTPAATHAKNFDSTDYAYALLKAERAPTLRVVFYFEQLDYSFKARRGYGERLCRRLHAETSVANN